MDGSTEKHQVYLFLLFFWVKEAVFQATNENNKMASTYSLSDET